MLSTLIFTLLSTCIYSAQAVDPTVSLSYGKYRGTLLNNGLTQWLGMRYAAAPVGGLRFAAPQDPPLHDGILPANKLAPGCMGVGPGIPGGTAEDCLYLDIYAPSTATTLSKLPVYFFIQGGGFNGATAHFNGSGLIQAAGNNIITVSLTYRGGAFGFLAGIEILRNASLNNGLKDQRHALEWVQKHVSAFGGDPNHVVLGGQSAGAGSVAHHLAAYGGRDDHLFHAAAAQSQSFPAIRTIAESQYQFDNLVARANCSSDLSSLACLRALDLATFQSIHLSDPFPGTTGPPIFSYNPCLDHDFVTNYPHRSFAAGAFIHVPTIFGDVTNEGTIFTDQSITTPAASEAFLVKQFPALTPAQLSQYATLYSFGMPDSQLYWNKASLAYGETRYVCPGIFLSSTLAQHSNPRVWNYRFDVLDPDLVAKGLNVPHGAEMPAIWGPEYVSAPASYLTTNRNITPVMQGYWTSFILSFDPNARRAPGTPKWESWVPSRQNRLMLRAQGTAMESVAKTPGQEERCAYVSSISVDIKQ